jgi:hypothetical protein
VGEIQQKILNHFFNCSYDSETVSQLSRTPAIFKSLKNKYLAKDKKFFSEKKKLFVTDKGAAAAVVLGITFDKLQDHFKKLGSETTSAAEQVRYLEKLKGILGYYHVTGSQLATPFIHAVTRPVPLQSFLLRTCNRYLAMSTCIQQES